MRIVIDLQGAQSASRNRGIGRYSLSLALAMARNPQGHEIILALNDLLPDTIEPIRAAFDGLLPQHNIRVWRAVSPMAQLDGANDWRRQSAEIIRESFLASLRPDVVHVSSPFEGSDATISIGRVSSNFVTAATLFDLIPFIHSKSYLENASAKTWYYNRLEHFRRADLWLAISESSRQEGMKYLELPTDRTFNILADADSQFSKNSIAERQERDLLKKYNLKHSFIMYTGGADDRKNVRGLIRAYAKLPSHLRATHQLAIVCSADESSKKDLRQVAAEQSLATDAVVLTGYVPDNDLVALYNLCALFVFPSWHEGFGLPVLEAMRCGAPVIGSSLTSVPEIIGMPEAMFDPHSDSSIAQAMERALTDVVFRDRLVENGRIQATKFSWGESARRAIKAMEHTVFKLRQELPIHSANDRPKLAYVSPLPPERTGIAGYSADLLPELARYYDIDVIVDQGNVTDPWIKANCPIRSVQWFMDNAGCYQRILYHFGNSDFHKHMFRLLKSFPGVVVLHDFYLSGLLQSMQASGYASQCFTEALQDSHGYAAISSSYKFKSIDDVVWKYPCSRKVIEDSKGIIVHSRNSMQLATRWYGNMGQRWSVIPLLRAPQSESNRDEARRVLGLNDDDFLVCSFGVLGPAKLNHRLLDAWFHSELARSKNCRLVFVGENHGGYYGKEIMDEIRHHRVETTVRITGWASDEEFRRYLAAADLAVQLRTLSRGETSAAVLDCMNFGLATIVNANGSMAELRQEAVYMLPDEFTDKELISALESLWRQVDRRQRLASWAREIILDAHNPARCAELYKKAIEEFYTRQTGNFDKLISSLVSIAGHEPGEDELMSLSRALAVTFPSERAPRRLFVDISELVQRDSQTGIQRVVRGLLREWLVSPPSGWHVEPVYATVDRPYRLARKFIAKFLGFPSDGMEDDLVDWNPGDVFCALDWNPPVQTAQRSLYEELRRRGVAVWFVVYDLPPLKLHDGFPAVISDAHLRWLEVVSKCDGAVCISKTVADELSERVAPHVRQYLRPFRIEWFHLGADLENSLPSKGIPPKSEAMPSLTWKQSAEKLLNIMGIAKPASESHHPLGLA